MGLFRRKTLNERQIQGRYNRWVRSTARHEQSFGTNFIAERTHSSDGVTVAEMLNTLAARAKGLGNKAARKVSTPTPKYGWVEEDL